MKLLIYGLLLLLFPLGATAKGRSAVEFTLLSYNIRCGFCEPETSINNWSKRKFLVAQLIANHNPDVIGLQEAELFQVKDLVAMLEGYSWIGVGRDDGKTQGESTAILFRTSRFSLKDQTTHWLSTTPAKPSLGWGAAYPRTFSTLLIVDRQTNTTLRVVNTHFDHSSETARQESARLLVDRLKGAMAAEPLVVMGDFNFIANSQGYKILTRKLKDAETISQLPATGGTKTFNGFGENTEAANKIDFVFVNRFLDVKTHHIDTTTYQNRFPSDHYPVVVSVKLSSGTD